MYYRIPTTPLPVIRERSINTRKTVWRCADKRNILVYMKDGSCIFTINGEDCLVSAGHFVLIPAEQPYVRKPYQDMFCTMLYIHFTTEEPIATITWNEMKDYAMSSVDSMNEYIVAPAVGEQKIDRYIFLPRVIEDKAKAERLSDLANRIHKESYNKHYSNLMTSLALMELLAMLGQAAMTEFRLNAHLNQKQYPLPLQKALIYINKNYRQKITIEQLCEHCNVSPQHLIRLFHKHLKTTPIHHINRNKVFHAIELLRSTEMSIKEISYELGYDDPNYFSRMFKKEEKMSPGETRKRIRSFAKEHRPSPATE